MYWKIPTQSLNRPLLKVHLLIILMNTKCSNVHVVLNHVRAHSLVQVMLITRKNLLILWHMWLGIFVCIIVMQEYIFYICQFYEILSNDGSLMVHDYVNGIILFIFYKKHCDCYNWIIIQSGLTLLVSSWMNGIIGRAIASKKVYINKLYIAN